MKLIIYDAGGIYELEIDPDELPEWITRAIELNS